jgi:hypothetical protein
MVRLGPDLALDSGRITLVLFYASAFSDTTPGGVLKAARSVRRRVRKSRQKEAAGAADAGFMQIEWSERRV